MNFFDVDIHVGGSARDFLDDENREEYIACIVAGQIDVIILSLPCGSWSRANWANNKGQRRRAERGNALVHFSIRAIVTAQQRKAEGSLVRCFLEHPEDLGRVGPHSLHQRVPAAIWQLDEVRKAFGDNKATTVAG